MCLPLSDACHTYTAILLRHAVHRDLFFVAVRARPTVSRFNCWNNFRQSLKLCDAIVYACQDCMRSSHSKPRVEYRILITYPQQVYIQTLEFSVGVKANDDSDYDLLMKRSAKSWGVMSWALMRSISPFSAAPV